jgi:hypothetical protein
MMAEQQEMNEDSDAAVLMADHITLKISLPSWDTKVNKMVWRAMGYTIR